MRVLASGEERGPSLGNVLLILGAGASAPLPTGLPVFSRLFQAVMEGMDWKYAGGGRWTHQCYGSFTAPALSPEVLFGSLAADHVEFAEQIAQRLSGGVPNAIHHFAAAVLRDGGCVWTTNVDLAVEAACADRPAIATRAWRRSPGTLIPLAAARPGVLVKFHGTVEVPTSLAFADRDLMTPLEDVDRRALASLAADKDVVLHGYAAADADLFDLLEDVFRGASSLRWFEPDKETRLSIGRAFPALTASFDPPTVPSGGEKEWKAAVGLTAHAFLDFADRCGISTAADLERDLLAASDQPHEVLNLRPKPPGISNARLVDRWGTPDEARRALWAARRHDLFNMRLSSFRSHLRWAASNRLYRGRLAPAAIRFLAPRPRLLALVPKPTWRDYVLTRHLALRLQDHDWQALQSFTASAEQVRTQLNLPANPADQYYQAQADRYQLRPASAREAADKAASGLSVLRDPERLAGAVYEAGSAALYQADFDAALRAAFDLRERRGRYAIPRWPAWGAWLEVITRCYLNQPDIAQHILDEEKGCQRFEDEQRPDALADLRTARLLLYRVQLAHGGPADPSVLSAPNDDWRTLRYRDDLDLLLADIAIAEGRHDDAKYRLSRVNGDPSCTVARKWAELGLAELERLDGHANAAADTFAALVHDAHARGATWLELQAVIGLAACADPREAAAWRAVRDRLPPLVRSGSAADLAVGSPRVLWMLTV